MCQLKIFLLSFKVMDVEVIAFSECFLFFNYSIQLFLIEQTMKHMCVCIKLQP